MREQDIKKIVAMNNKTQKRKKTAYYLEGFAGMLVLVPGLPCIMEYIHSRGFPSAIETALAIYGIGLGLIGHSVNKLNKLEKIVQKDVENIDSFS